jgi:hypothetical protein
MVALNMEYRFWMAEGPGRFVAADAMQRVNCVLNGVLVLQCRSLVNISLAPITGATGTVQLNRYFSETDDPRPESFREDWNTVLLCAFAMNASCCLARTNSPGRAVEFTMSSLSAFSLSPFRGPQAIAAGLDPSSAVDAPQLTALYTSLASMAGE